MLNPPPEDCSTARPWVVIALLFAAGTAVSAWSSVLSAQSNADPKITAFISRIRSVDNHSHANSVAPGDSDADALALGPDMDWEVVAWVAAKNGRAALALALTDMMRNGEVSRPRAEEIATMVMRTNAGKLYKLALK